MRYLLTFCVLFGMLSPSAAQKIPSLINYQGHIASEASLTNPIEISFAIYTEPETGQPLWTETHNVTHENGAFAVLLGSQTSFPENIFAGTHRYLEIRVANDTAFRPRQRIVSAAYAFRANQADNAVGHLTPKSITLGAAAIDSTGQLSTPHIQTDSLTIGDIGIVNKQGQWTGPPIPTESRGMVLDTLIVRNLENTLSFGSATWLDIDGSTDALTVFINLETEGFLDISFHTTVSATSDAFETRLAVTPVNPGGDPITNISNISRFIPKTSSDEGILSNQAAVYLSPGLYRVFVQGQIQSIGTLLTGILTVRAFTK